MPIIDDTAPQEDITDTSAPTPPPATSPDLFDRKTKSWIPVAPEDVSGLVASGSHAFAKGLRIPVVTKDGQVGDIPSEEAQKAFQSGEYRWLTPEDERAYQDRKNEEILQKQADAPGTATAGFLSGRTFGLSNVIAPKYADLVYGEGSGEAVKEGIRLKKERNPGTYLGFEMLGALTGGPSGLIKGAKEGVSLLREAGAIGEATKATTTLGKIARTAAREGAEGLVYGFGEGVDEASLGDPSEVAENIASSTAYGGLFGGAFGASFGLAREIAPTAKVFVSKKAYDATDALQNTTRKAVAALGERLIGGEKGKVFGDTIRDKEFLKLAAEHGDDYAALKKDFDLAVKTGEEEASKIRKGLSSYLETAPKEIRNYIDNDLLPRADGNIQRAMTDLDSQVLGKESVLDANLRTTAAPASSDVMSHFEDSDKLVKQLRETGNTKSIRLATKLEAMANAEKARYGLKGAVKKSTMLADEIPEKFREQLVQMTAADERRILLEQRQTVKEAISGALKDTEAKGVLDRYYKTVTDKLHGHEAFGAEQAHIDGLNGAYQELRGFLTGAKDVAVKDVKQSVLNEILTDTRKAARYNEFMTNISKFTPEMEAFRLAGENAIKKEEALQSILSKINETKSARASMGEKLTTEDLEKLLKGLDPPANITNQLSRLQTLETTLQANTGSPANNMLSILRAFGHPISDLQERILSKGDRFEALEKAFSKRHDPNTVEKLLKLAIKRPIRTLASGAIGTAVGNQMGGGVLGDSTGAILGAAAASAINPRFVIKNLAKLARVSEQAAERSAKATQKAIEALTSDKARKVVTASAGTFGGAFSLKDSRKDFKQRAEFTSKMANDPNALADEFENRFGDMQHTPAVSAAMMAQFAKTAQFLDSKLPKDPLAGQYLSASMSKWTPTDYQLAEYERFVRAAQDPTSVVEDIARGRVTPEAIETLKTLNPNMFKQLHDGVLDAIMKPDVNLSYKQKLHLGTLFDIPTDPTMTPTFINTMQSTYQEQEQSGQGQNAMSPKKSIHIDINPEATATETSRISNSN